MCSRWRFGGSPGRGGRIVMSVSQRPSNGTEWAVLVVAASGQSTKAATLGAVGKFCEHAATKKPRPLGLQNEYGSCPLQSLHCATGHRFGGTSTQPSELRQRMRFVGHRLFHIEHNKEGPLSLARTSSSFLCRERRHFTFLRVMSIAPPRLAHLPVLRQAGP